MKKLITAIIIIFSLGASLSAAATGNPTSCDDADEVISSDGSGATGNGEGTSTPTPCQMSWRLVSGDADALSPKKETIRYFNVYELIQKIALTQGIHYDAYTSLETHPGSDKTKELIRNLITVVLQEQKDQHDFIDALHTKLMDLPPERRQDKTAYQELDPIFNYREFFGNNTRKWHDDILIMLSPEPFEAGIQQLARIDSLFERPDFTWELFMHNITYLLSGFLKTKETNSTCSISTQHSDLLDMFKQGAYWCFFRAEREITFCSIYLSIIRLCLAHIDGQTLDHAKLPWTTYSLDKILYDADELEERPICPDSLIQKKHARNSKIKRKTYDITEEYRRWEKIKQNPRKPMPNPFGTKAKKEAEEKVAAEAEEKAFLATLGKAPAQKLSKRQIKENQRKAAGAPVVTMDKEPSSLFPSAEEVADNLPPCISNKIITGRTPKDIQDRTLQLVDRMAGYATTSLATTPTSSPAFMLTEWVKHETEDRYIPTATTGALGKFKLTRTQKTTIDAIHAKTRFAFGMEAFLNLMNALGINCSGQRGSHMHINTPGQLRKIFVDPHGWTDKFGPSALNDMHDLINSLSLGVGSEFLEFES